MDKDNFKKLIRKMIKEEVSEQLNIKMAGLLSEMMNHQPVQVAPTPPIRQERAASTPKKQYTTNSVLNDILNETVVRIPLEDSVVSLETPMEKVGVIEPDGTNLGFLKSMLSESAVDKQSNGGTQSILENINRSEDVPHEVKVNLTKDYRSLMKAIDKKKKG